MSESVVDADVDAEALNPDRGSRGGATAEVDGVVKVDAEEKAQRTFSTSIVISAIRCLLTYIFFPFVAPLIGLSSRIGPSAGVVIGVVAIIANLFSIRRFHRADHKWKWHITTLNVAVIGLLAILLYVDIGDLIR